MKKQFFFYLLTLTVLAGCSKSENGIDADDNARVPIRLTSGIGTMTKATVTDGSVGTGDNVSAQFEFWEVNGNNNPTYTGSSSTWQSTATVTSAVDAAAITLNKSMYYNADNAIKTHIKGWYPKVASSKGTVTITNTTGTVDVLLSNTVSGSKNTQVSTAVDFKHQTTQLIFKVLKGTGLLAGTKIKSITVHGAEVPTSIVLGTPDEVKYTSVVDLKVPSLQVAEITATDNATAIAGKPLMIKKVDDNSTLTLTIETTLDGTTTAATYTNVTFSTTESKLEMGKAYTISLTFKQTSVTPTAKITPWDPSTGSGDVI